MKANQTVKLTPEEEMLSEAMGIHMGDDNCYGRLIVGEWVAKPGRIGRIFHCSYCDNEVIGSMEATQ